MSKDRTESGVLRGPAYVGCRLRLNKPYKVRVKVTREECAPRKVNVQTSANVA